MDFVSFSSLPFPSRRRAGIDNRSGELVSSFCTELLLDGVHPSLSVSEPFLK